MPTDVYDRALEAVCPTVKAALSDPLWKNHALLASYQLAKSVVTIAERKKAGIISNAAIRKMKGKQADPEILLAATRAGYAAAVSYLVNGVKIEP